MKFKNLLNELSTINNFNITCDEQQTEQQTEQLNIDTINEVAFNETKILKVATLYAKIMSRKMSGIFHHLGVEEFKRKSGPGRGLRFMNNTGEMLRFNWDEKLAKKSQNVLTSIDYWRKGNYDLQKPTRTVTFGPELNVVQVLEQITDALLTGNINEAQAYIDEANLLLEAPTAKEKQEWLTKHGMPKSLAGSLKGMKARAEKEGLLGQLEVFLGEKETNSFEGKLKETEKQLSKEVYADPETVFEDIEDLLSVVAAGKWRTLVVCGMGGVGKCVQGETLINVEGL